MMQVTAAMERPVTVPPDSDLMLVGVGQVVTLGEDCMCLDKCGHRSW
jgi:hypothetical protein